MQVLYDVNKSSFRSEAFEKKNNSCSKIEVFPLFRIYRI